MTRQRLYRRAYYGRAPLSRLDRLDRLSRRIHWGRFLVGLSLVFAVVLGTVVVML